MGRGHDEEHHDTRRGQPRGRHEVEHRPAGVAEGGQVQRGAPEEQPHATGWEGGAGVGDGLPQAHADGDDRGDQEVAVGQDEPGDVELDLRRRQGVADGVGRVVEVHPPEAGADRERQPPRRSRPPHPGARPAWPSCRSPRPTRPARSARTGRSARPGAGRRSACPAGGGAAPSAWRDGRGPQMATRAQPSARAPTTRIGPVMAMLTVYGLIRKPSRENWATPHQAGGPVRQGEEEGSGRVGDGERHEQPAGNTNIPMRRPRHVPDVRLDGHADPRPVDGHEDDQRAEQRAGPSGRPRGGSRPP